MTTYTIATLKDDLQAILHGTSLNDIANPSGVINRAARDLLSDLDPMETKRVYQFTAGVFDSGTGAYNYLLPADLKSNKVIDIRPQVNRLVSNNFVQHTSKEFDLYKSISSVSIDNDTGLKYIRISADVYSPIIYNGLDNTTGSNGTNAASGIITSLAQDTFFKVNGSASLSFNMSGSGTGYIENSTLASTDFTKYQNVAYGFLWVYIPSSPTSLTNVELRWGSSSSAYWAANATTNFWSQSFVVGWNLLSFAWPSTSTGTPTVTACRYNRITFTWSGGAVNSFRADDVFFALPSIYEMVYYSKYVFQNSSGTWIESTTADTDLVNLDTDSYNLLLYKCAEVAALQIQQAIPLRGKLSNFDFDSYGGIYKERLARYKSNYRSESLKIIGNYYRNRYGRIR